MTLWQASGDKNAQEVISGGLKCEKNFWAGGGGGGGGGEGSLPHGLLVHRTTFARQPFKHKNWHLVLLAQAHLWKSHSSNETSTVNSPHPPPPPTPSQEALKQCK